MAASSRREARSGTIAAESARGRGGGASRKPPGPALPTMAPPPELIALQCKMQGNAKPDLPSLPVDTDAGPRASSTGLPRDVKTGIERLSGMSMSDVRVFYDSEKPIQLQAHAFTQGNAIHVAPGQEKHVAHEAWHAVQRKQGRVPTTMQRDGVAINDDPVLEREADDKATELERMAQTNGAAADIASSPVSDNSAMATAPIQRKINTRLKTQWYRRRGNSNSSIVNMLIDDYNATSADWENTELRLSKLDKIKEALAWVNLTKSQATSQIRKAIRDERDIIERQALFGHPVGRSARSEHVDSNAAQDQPKPERQQQARDLQAAAAEDAQLPVQDGSAIEQWDEQDDDDNDAVPNNADPISMQQLLAYDDMVIDTLCQRTSVKGPLMGILKGAFEANWFKAKDCLVFGKWPGHDAPAFSSKKSLDLMTALTVLRGNVHKEIMRLAKEQVFQEILRRSQQVKSSPSFAMSLAEDGAYVPPNEQVEYKGSVGADTVTSDVDVSTGGKNSELAVRAYNEVFRNVLDVEFDPGTVFDLNVYSMDFVHGATPTKVDDRLHLNVKAEHPNVHLKPELAAKRDQEQEIWALVHIARYLPDDKDWNAFVKQSLPIGNPQMVEPLREKYSIARKRALAFEKRLVSMMNYLENNDEELRGSLEKASAWGQDNHHFTEDALRMRAANRIYEDKLLQVKELRAKIVTLEKQPDRTKDLHEAVARLSGEISMAQLYANEVYGSGGATVHAVFGMQTKRKLEKDKEKNPGKLPVDVKLTPAEWYQAFNDNLGDVMKDYLHFATPHGNHKPDYWYAAFKMGKYANRMIDVLPHLSESGLILEAEAEQLEGCREARLLGEVARNHLARKDDVGGSDPQQLAQDGYFGHLNAADVEEIKIAALSLGAKVRSMVEGNKVRGRTHVGK